MAALMNTLAPSVTEQIRADHSHVLATFRQYRSDMPAARKQALVRNVCLAVEIHADLEEEIFYPAMRELAPDTEVVSKSFAEHDELRVHLTRLRAMSPDDPDYEKTFMELVRDVLHHVADEETTLLPASEKLLPERLGELGLRMARRRVELTAQRAGELGASTWQALPESALGMATAAWTAGTEWAGRMSTVWWRRR
ncbi:MAG TPA: hemerythrin domain-containing protein [Burkholderiaceae bacterium]|nr:hemerythrin domain-containing protein [Burkholderiaceae bacterium]